MPWSKIISYITTLKIAWYVSAKKDVQTSEFQNTNLANNHKLYLTSNSRRRLMIESAVKKYSSLCFGFLPRRPPKMRYLFGINAQNIWDSKSQRLKSIGDRKYGEKLKKKCC